MWRNYLTSLDFSFFFDPDAGKDRKQEEKGATEDEKVEWPHRLDGHEWSKLGGDGEDREAWRASQSVGSQRVRHD